MSNKIGLVDTCYWIALLDRSDQYSTQAGAYSELLLKMKYIVPWPTLYETLCTRMMKNERGVARFEAILKRENAIFIEDTRYRDAALRATFSKANIDRRISLVDAILRSMIEDRSIKKHCLFTFNSGDFLDVCIGAGIEILPDV